VTDDLGEACAAIARAVADSLDLSEVVGRVAAAARLVVAFDAMGVWHARAPDDPLSLIAGPGASDRVGPHEPRGDRAGSHPKGNGPGPEQQAVAAKLLGLPRGQLYLRLKRHGLDWGKS